jgi:hypothetical protein
MQTKSSGLTKEREKGKKQVTGYAVTVIVPFMKGCTVQ